MKNFALAAFTCVLLLSGCATGPKHSEVASSIPALKADQGRVYFYRTAIVGAAVRPDVRLNGTVVGSAVPGGFFFVDQPPGACEVSTSTEVEKKLTFTLAAGDTRYVRLNMNFGLLVGRVVPELTPAAEATKEIADLSYAGTTALKK